MDLGRPIGKKGLDDVRKIQEEEVAAITDKASSNSIHRWRCDFMRLPILSFIQPIGEFALSVMNARDILKISYVDRREFDQVSLDSYGGPQRQKSTSRIKRNRKIL